MPTAADLDYAEVGKAGAALLRSEDQWIHRRVERIRLGDLVLLERCISLDFTIPESSPEIGFTPDGESQTFLPVSVLQKRPPVMTLDIKDENGRSVPLLTSAQTSRADTAVLIESAKHVLGVDKLPKKLRRDIAGISFWNVPAALVFRRRLLVATAGRSRDALYRNKLNSNTEFVELATQLTTTSILWIPVERVPGARRIFKLVYGVPLSQDLWGPGNRFLQAIGWADRSYWFELAHMGASVNYHLHFDSAPYMGITEANIGAAHRSSSVLPGPDPKPQIMPEHAHLYLPEQRSGVGGFAWVTLKFRRTGEVTGALLGAIGVAALMGGMNAISDAALEESNKALTVAVLLVAPVIVVAYLAGPVRKLGDREVLPGIRHVLNATVALPIIAAFFAIGASEKVTQKAWLVLLILAVLLVGVLAISVARSTGDGRRN